MDPVCTLKPFPVSKFTLIQICQFVFSSGTSPLTENEELPVPKAEENAPQDSNEERNSPLKEVNHIDSVETPRNGTPVHHVDNSSGSDKTSDLESSSCRVIETSAGTEGTNTGLTSPESGHDPETQNTEAHSKSNPGTPDHCDGDSAIENDLASSIEVPNGSKVADDSTSIGVYEKSSLESSSNSKSSCEIEAVSVDVVGSDTDQLMNANGDCNTQNVCHKDDNYQDSHGEVEGDKVIDPINGMKENANEVSENAGGLDDRDGTEVGT